MTRPTRRVRSNSSARVPTNTNTNTNTNNGSEDTIRHSSRFKSNNDKPPKKQPSNTAPDSMSNAGPTKGSTSTSTSTSRLKAISSTGKLISVTVQLNGSRFGFRGGGSEHHKHNSPQESSSSSSSRRMRTSTHANAHSNSHSNSHRASRGNPDESTSHKQNGETDVQNTLGDDGNQYFCDTCQGVGDVVCCDGCPRVYHPTCIPEQSKSRLSLDTDDPWYCPTCMEEGKASQPRQPTQPTRKGSSSRAAGNSAGGDSTAMDQRTSSRCKKMCVECHKSGGGKMGKCERCHATMHIPTCRTNESADYSSSNVTCSNCLAEFVVDDEEEERRLEADISKAKAAAAAESPHSHSHSSHKPAAQSAKEYLSESSLEMMSPPSTTSHGNNNIGGNANSSAGSANGSGRPSTKNDEETAVRGRGRPRGSTNQKSKSDDNRPTKKMKKDDVNDNVNNNENENDNTNTNTNTNSNTNGNNNNNNNNTNNNINAEDETSFRSLTSSKRSLPEKTTLPFFFFLLENRIKLERQLSRKNRSYKRMKGYPRNLLLAKEGAITWAKTTKIERNKYIAMSIQEFEYNVITWKEDETLREMMIAEGNKEQEVCTLASEELNLSDADVTPKDNDYWDRKFDSLVAPSQISCRKIKSNSESIQNGVLLELLQDSRFHSLPMMKANRDCKSELQDNSMTAVPYFHVQGPISTSIGDGCLGCIRGWNHFCPILKSHFPAVEHRAKLQPPCPSHLNARIGIGLPISNEEEQKYSYNDKKSYRDLRFLSHPSTRGDEIVKLVETAMAVKLPGKGAQEEEQQPFYKRKKSSTNSKRGKQDLNLYECGRCKIGTTSKMGCVTCRRVKLLVDLSKKTPGDKDNLSLQTVMLGRANTRSDEFDEQTAGEKKIAQGMVKRPWKPNAILPPTKKRIPPKYPPSNDDESSSEDDASSISSSPSKIEENISEIENEFEATEATEQPEENDDTQSSEDEPIPKRRRLTRSAVSKTNEETSKIESSRQALAEVHKEEADNLYARCLVIATCGILLAMIRRDPLRLFAEPVPANVEGYHKIIKKPMDLSTMKHKVLNAQYSTLGAFMSDARLLCLNSLVYNPPGTIYSMTAEEIQGVLRKMQKRASRWMCAIKNTHASQYARYHTQSSNTGRKLGSSLNDSEGKNDDVNNFDNDLFQELRENWPGAVELLEDNGKWLRSQIEAEFVRTKENEFAYYATLTVRRAAKAAEASLSPIFESDSVFTPCIRRSHTDDEALRNYINRIVAAGSDPREITSTPSWREQDVLELLKKVQKRRVESKTSPEDGCARCDKISIDDEANKLARETAVIRRRKKNDGVQVRISESRRGQSNGMASKRERDRVLSNQNESLKSLEASNATARDRSVTVRGSGIQGWGLFADHPFKKGELVAEYVGEYVVNPMADKREKFYEERRIQDYQFRVGANLVIDATKLGGHARYINHSCEPSCLAKIIDGDPPNKHLKRVVVISQRDIQAGEEITYDYQFPLELDLDARIPCNCGSKSCRGFMNWDLPELGSMVARASTRQGRRDRIRRLVNKAL